MGKGETTRARIIDEAIRVASVEGLAGLTIGRLADRTRMSKSGLFAHFASREAVELAVLEQAIARFRDTVILAALREPRGEPRIRAIVERWHDWANDPAVMPGGCLLLQRLRWSSTIRRGRRASSWPRRFANGAIRYGVRRRSRSTKAISVPISIRRSLRSNSRASCSRHISPSGYCARRVRRRECDGPSTR